MNRLFKELKESFVDIFRSGLVAVISIIAMSMALLSVATVFLLNIAFDSAESAVFSRLDISVRIAENPDPARVELLINDLKRSEYVDSDDLIYLTKEQAFDDFKDYYSDKPELQQFIANIDNPLYSSLVIKTDNPQDHPFIHDILLKDTYKNVVTDITGSQHQADTINRISAATDIVNRIGMTVGILFIVVAMGSVYNTTRLTIYSRKNEIDIMKLVGASYARIRRPFIREGILYGIIGAIVSILALFPLVSMATRGIFTFLSVGPQEVFAFIGKTVPHLIILNLLIGIVLGMTSSLFATLAYLDSKKA